MDPIRVVIADDNHMVRQGIRLLLEKEPDIQILAEAANGAEALTLVEQIAPDVLLLDVQMPVMDGIQVAQKLRESKSPVKILAVSAYDDQQLVAGLLRTGARGYLLKEDVPVLLAICIRSVVQTGGLCLSPRITAYLNE